MELCSVYLNVTARRNSESSKESVAQSFVPPHMSYAARGPAGRFAWLAEVYRAPLSACGWTVL